ncbi:hypothetical protein Bbelb_079700 [Branchiostoma belcheri]|nr:hypothetical protein Bbelb_079700 [Branchiostoma belcheri]
MQALAAPQHTPSVRGVNFRARARRARIRECKEISGAVHAEPGNPWTRPGHGEFHGRDDPVKTRKQKKAERKNRKRREAGDMTKKEQENQSPPSKTLHQPELTGQDEGGSTMTLHFHVLVSPDFKMKPEVERVHVQSDIVAWKSLAVLEITRNLKDGYLVAEGKCSMNPKNISNKDVHFKYAVVKQEGKPEKRVKWEFIHCHIREKGSTLIFNRCFKLTPEECQAGGRQAAIVEAKILADTDGVRQVSVRVNDVVHHVAILRPGDLTMEGCPINTVGEGKLDMPQAGEVHLYHDTMQMERGPGVKETVKTLVGWSREEKVAHDRQIALHTWLPQWKGFTCDEDAEEQPACDVMKHVEDVCRWMENSPISAGYRIWKWELGKFSITKVLMEYISPKLDQLEKTEHKKESPEEAQARIVSALSLCWLVNRFSLALTEKQVHTLFDGLLIRPDVDKSCHEVEAFSLHFYQDGRLKEVTDAVVNLINTAMSGNALKSRWLLALPVLHFLRNESSPFKPVVPTTDFQKASPEWLGLEGLEYRRFKDDIRDSSTENSLLLAVMQELDPALFEADRLLERSCAAILTNKELLVLLTLKPISLPTLCAAIAVNVATGYSLSLEEDRQEFQSLLQVLETATALAAGSSVTDDTADKGANTIISDPADRSGEIDHVTEALKKCGYPQWLIRKAYEPRQPRSKPQDSHDQGTGGKKRKTLVVLPYVKGVSEPYVESLLHTEQLLVAPKDKTPKEDKCGVIYHILSCQGNTNRGPCQETYIGETERSLKTRFLEHRRPSSVASEVSQHIHIESPGHTVDLEGVRILDTEQDYFKGGIKEAIYRMYIRALQPSLNRDGGQYRLQTTFDPLLTSHVGKITDDATRKEECQTFCIANKVLLSCLDVSTDLDHHPILIGAVHLAAACFSNLWTLLHSATEAKAQNTLTSMEKLVEEATSFMMTWLDKKLIKKISISSYADGEESKVWQGVLSVDWGKEEVNSFWNEILLGMLHQRLLAEFLQEDTFPAGMSCRKFCRNDSVLQE